MVYWNSIILGLGARVRRITQTLIFLQHMKSNIVLPFLLIILAVSEEIELRKRGKGEKHDLNLTNERHLKALGCGRRLEVRRIRLNIDTVQINRKVGRFSKSSFPSLIHNL